MKRIMTFAFLLVLPWAAEAQEELPCDEVTVSIGANEDNGAFKDLPELGYNSPMEKYYNQKYFLDHEHEGPTISAGYRHKLSSHFFVGGYLAYKGSSSRLYSNITCKQVDTYRIHYAMAMPCVRFYIHDNNYVRVYAEAAGGILSSWERKLGNDSYKNCVRGAYHLTIAGIDFTIAKHFTLSAAIGSGHLGYVQAGAGYRF